MDQNRKYIEFKFDFCFRDDSQLIDWESSELSF